MAFITIKRYKPSWKTRWINYEESLFADELPMPNHDNIRGEDYYK